jgi:hypothetical protein
LDGHPTYRRTVAKNFAADSNGRPRLCLLPGYSPELNPDGWVWTPVKDDRVGRASVHDLKM